MKVFEVWNQTCILCGKASCNVNPRLYTYVKDFPRFKTGNQCPTWKWCIKTVSSANSNCALNIFLPSIFACLGEMIHVKKRETWRLNPAWDDVKRRKAHKDCSPGRSPRGCRNARSRMVATSGAAWSSNGPSGEFPGQCIVPHCWSYWRGTPGEGSTWGPRWVNTAAAQAGSWGQVRPCHIPVSWRTAQT